VSEGTARSRCLGAIESWLATQVELEVEGVTLPISGQQYTVRRPDQASRDRLFAEARADPDRQAPHWAKVWPSGVALADAVVRYADEVRDRRVLELGAGLGVTASAILAAGATLLAADYSSLSLTLCRYNTLMNSGRSPKLVRFNWRTPLRPSLLRLEATGGIPLILAADVLYEGRDVRPLLDVIERLLAPGGMLWLAEPNRRTARRFLDLAASVGWQGVSRSTYGPWPDGSTDRVNLHFLRRSNEFDEVPASLGGWRIY
jgi:predicted nicotinamide N-methyase